MEIGYWNIRGLLAPIQYLDEYCKTGAKFVKYDVHKTEDGWDRSAWFDVKFDKGMVFPNLPYLLDGEVRISESWAVLKYLARKSGKCLPTNNKDWAVAEQLEGFLSDFRMGFIRVAYMGADAKTHFSNVVKQLDQLSAELGEKNWFLGDISYVDFWAWEIIDHHVCYKKSFLDGHENLKNWHQRFRNLEAVKTVMAGDNWNEYPINNKMAVFGGMEGSLD